MWGSCPQETIIILLKETTPLLCLLGLLACLLACLAWLACLFACLACLGHLSHWPFGALGFQLVGGSFCVVFRWAIRRTGRLEPWGSSWWGDGGREGGGHGEEEKWVDLGVKSNNPTLNGGG